MSLNFQMKIDDHIHNMKMGEFKGFLGLKTYDQLNLFFGYDVKELIRFAYDWAGDDFKNKNIHLYETDKKSFYNLKRSMEDKLNNMCEKIYCTIFKINEHTHIRTIANYNWHGVELLIPQYIKK